MPSIDPERWRGCERWGMLRGSTAALMAQALEAGRSQGWFTALLPYLVTNMTSGGNLAHKEALALREWLDGKGMRDVELEDVQVVQPNYSDLVDILGHREAVTRAISAWEVGGILTRAVKGWRGHSSVYVVEPLAPP